MCDGDASSAWVLDTVEAALKNGCSIAEFRDALDAIIILGGSMRACMRGILFSDGEICDVTPVSYAALFGRTDALDAILERGGAIDCAHCTHVAEKAGHHAFAFYVKTLSGRRSFP